MKRGFAARIPKIGPDVGDEPGDYALYVLEEERARLQAVRDGLATPVAANDFTAMGRLLRALDSLNDGIRTIEQQKETTLQSIASAAEKMVTEDRAQ